MVAFLWLPKPWTITAFDTDRIIEIQVLESQSIPDKPAIENTPAENMPIEPVPKEPNTEVPAEPPVETASAQVESVVAPQAEQKPTAKPQSSNENQVSDIISKPVTQPKINTGDVLEMIESRQSIDITPEFQARTHTTKDFYIPEQEIENWMADIPFLDESVDKPKLEMRFYAEGIEGSIEKFFDKITISKTFTTKYGTKIHCAIIGVIAACGWK